MPGNSPITVLSSDPKPKPAGGVAEIFRHIHPELEHNLVFSPAGSAEELDESRFSRQKAADVVR